MSEAVKYKLGLTKTVPFALLHLAPLLVFWVGFSWTALTICCVSYFIRMFGITGGFHRYFSHKSYKTSRFFQFCLAFLGGTAAQKGVLWWSAHHRHHHRNSDTEDDLHSPGLKGFWWSHMGWFLATKYDKTEYDKVPDYKNYPELKFLTELHYLPPVIYALSIFWLGFFLNYLFPGLGITGMQAFVWGFAISTILLYQGTFTVNSLTHIMGRKRFNTKDNSRNSLIISLITLGEGWHNNHHYYPASERQGFYWWQIDITHYILKFLSFFGIVWDIQGPTDKILARGRGKI